MIGEIFLFAVGILIIVYCLFNFPKYDKSKAPALHSVEYHDWVLSGVNLLILAICGSICVIMSSIHLIKLALK